MDDMKPEDRDALILKLSSKLKDMTDDELQDLAKELDVDAEDSTSADLAAAPAPVPLSKPVVDTGTLTSPLSQLKSFLIKKQQDNDKAE